MSSSGNAGCNADPTKLGEKRPWSESLKAPSEMEKLEYRIATQKCSLKLLMLNGKLNGGLTSGPYMGLVKPGELGGVPLDKRSTEEDIRLLRAEIQQCENLLRQIKDDARVEQTKARESECWRPARKCVRVRKERHSWDDPRCKGRKCGDTSSDEDNTPVDPWGDGSKASEKPNA